jgi:nucleotide-binding universal stress UspA family protein
MAIVAFLRVTRGELPFRFFLYNDSLSWLWNVRSLNRCREVIMQNGKDRFGDKLRLVRRARENIYFAERDRQLIERLRSRLRKVERAEGKNPKSKQRPNDRPARKNVAAPKTYLVPIDFSKGSEIALQHAIRIACENNGKLLLFHVLNENLFHSGTILPKDYVEILEKQARDRLHKMARTARLQPGEYRSILVWGSDTARRIVSYAKKLKASMIIMGSHGRTGLKRLMLGSVAERTLRYAECPVLIVKK